MDEFHGLLVRLPAIEYDDLHWTFQKMDHGDSVGGGEDSEFASNACKSLKSLLCLFLVSRIAGVVIQPQRGDRGQRISCRGWRILQRLAARGKHTQALAIDSGFGIEESPRNRIKEARVHGIGNGSREFEVTDIGSCLVSVEACKHSRGIVIEQTGNLPVLRSRIGVRHHMQKARGLTLLMRFPRLRQNAVE